MISNLFPFLRCAQYANEKRKNSCNIVVSKEKNFVRVSRIKKSVFSILAMQSYLTLSIELHDSNVLSQVITSKFHEFRRHHLARIGVKHLKKTSAKNYLQKKA